jgi:integrase
VIDFFGNASFNYDHDIKRAFAVACRRAEVANFKFHDLRHTYASWLAQAGVDLYVIKELLGHSTIIMTQRYAHLAPSTKKTAVKLLTDVETG